MQICVQDVFAINFSRLTCYDTVSWYDTTLTSLLINYGATSAFCMHVMYDTSYDTPIVSSLMYSTSSPLARSVTAGDGDRGGAYAYAWVNRAPLADVRIQSRAP
jgi:hypothetical protein